MQRGLHETHPLGSAFRPGIVVGRKFTLLRLIAQGGYGAVYEAEDNLIHRRVAIKLLHPDVAAMPDVVRRFMREAQVLAKIDHPNVVTIHEMGQRRDGSYFIVQELLSGGTLRELLVEKTRLEPQEAVDLLEPIMGALVAAHRRGIIHRDLKPDNIVLARTSSGDLVPKLIDFGVAKTPRTGNWGTSTVLGHLLGTPHYMAPEQISGSQPIDTYADVWAMGVVLFELLSGRCPFEGEPSKVLFKIQTEPMPRLESLVSDVAPELGRIVHQALEREVARRPTMQSLREELLAFRAGHRGRAAIVITPAARQPITPAGQAAGDNAARGVELIRSFMTPTEPVLIEALGLSLDPIDAEADELPLSSRDFIQAEDAQAASFSGDRAQARPDMEWTDELPLPDKPAVRKHFLDAERALSVNALDDAIVHAERAFALSHGAGEVAGRARLVQAIACSWLGGHADAERSAVEAVSFFRRGGLAWYTALGHLALARGHLGRRNELVDIAQDLSAIEAAGLVTQGHLVAACRLVVSLVRVGSPDVAQKALNGVLSRASKHALTGPFARAWLSVARAELAAHNGDPMMYLQCVTASADAFTEAGDVRHACLQRVNTGNAYIQLGGYAQAEALMRDALTVAEPMELGFVASLKANLGFALARLRRIDEAAAMETEALEQCIRDGYKRFECVARIYLATIYALQDNVGKAMARAKEAIGASDDFPAIQAYAQATLARLLLLQNQSASALRLAQDAMAVLDRLEGVEEGEALIRVVYASALHATNNRAKALAAIAEARSRLLARAGKIGDPRWSRSFLENVPENARTMHLAVQWSKGDSDLLI